MLNNTHFLEDIIRPTLVYFEMSSVNAEVLLLGTANAESNLTYLKQLNNGPALGPYQMEPKTEKDIWDNYLKYRPDLANRVAKFILPGLPRTMQLKGNLYYATIMARLHYKRVKYALPKADDPFGMAKYHKDHYNTSSGKADPFYNVTHFQNAAILILKGEK